MSELDTMLNQAPTLTLEPFAEPKPEVPAMSETQVVEAVKEQMNMELTPEEQKMVNDFAEQIDLSNSQMILQYGAGSQKKIADFSESALGSVRTKDMGERWWASCAPLRRARTRGDSWESLKSPATSCPI